MNIPQELLVFLIIVLLFAISNKYKSMERFVQHREMDDTNFNIMSVSNCDYKYKDDPQFASLSSTSIQNPNSTCIVDLMDMESSEYVRKYILGL